MLKLNWNNLKETHYFKISDLILIFFVILSTILLFLLPVKGMILGSAGDMPEIAKSDNSLRVKAEVLEVDNKNLLKSGLVKTGEQYFEAKILDSKFKGKNTKVVNYLSGSMQLDGIFKKGDKVLVTLRLNDQSEIAGATAVDHYRIEIEIILLVVFALLLILFAGLTGIKAALSFVFTGAVIWKILLPSFLAGWNPILIAFGAVSTITFAIIFLIGGVSLRGLVAYLGSMTGVALTAFLAIYFANLMKIEGAVKEFSETLLYAGYEHLDLTSIFIGGIFIASSGAVMDIAMDISASMAEIKLNRKDIKLWPHIKSGFTVGRAVIGTMTTTLLLAYSGSYTTLLLLLVAQGTPTINILNLRFVAAEILNTLVGSFGLILVAPVTAVIGGIIYSQMELD